MLTASDLLTCTFNAKHIFMGSKFTNKPGFFFITALQQDSFNC